jgi:glucokinase
LNDLQTLIRERRAHHSRGLFGDQGYILGIDCGSYGLRAALLNLQTNDLSTAQTDMAGSQPDETVEHAIHLARGVLHEANVSPGRLIRVAIGFNGPVNQYHGTVQFMPRMPGWENYPLQERFEQAFDAVTLIDNDANLIALGETTFGAGHNHQHVFYLHLSSGVGGGMVLEGRLYQGSTSLAGEIGHAVVGHGWDGTGRPATLEELASINGLIGRARALGLETNDLVDIFGEQPLGRQVVRELTDLIATRLAQIVALLDPEIIILGGITVRIGGDAFVKSISERVNGFLAPQLHRPIPVAPSILGSDSVAIGALARAIESLSD